MNRLQKIALYHLMVIVVVSIVVGLTFGLVAHFKGPQHARGVLGLLGLFGLMGLGGVIFRKKGGQVDFDERDLLIRRRSAAIAYSVFWIVWILGSMTIWAVLKEQDGTVSVNILPIMVLIGGLVVVTVQSVAILVQYRMGDRGVGKSDNE